MKGVFISYRRQDSQSAAGRLADHLHEQLPDIPLFRDVETIEPGVDFVEAINHALASCGILLAVIGPRWVSMTDASGRRRLDSPDDYARLEISTALQRGDVRVIPVLVEGASMPGADELPEELRPLVRRNAIELTDKRWEFDVSMLVETLRKALGLAPSPTPRPEPKLDPEPVPRPAGNWKKWALGFGALAIVVALVQETETPSGGTSITGAWRDAQGGQYQIVEQQGQVLFRGTSAYGPVSGTGVIQGNQFSFTYALNGAPYQAVVMLSADGMYLQGQYRSQTTAENGMVALQRVR